MKKRNRSVYRLENVTVAPYCYTYIIRLPVFVTVFLTYGHFGMRYFGFLGLIIVLVLTLGIIYFILKKRSKTIVIGFDSQFFYINDNKYCKEEIKGLYCYDYINHKKSIISIRINFYSGEKIEITDTDFGNRYDEVKAGLLTGFLKKAVIEFNFKKSGKSTIRALQNFGAYWYGNN